MPKPFAFVSTREYRCIEGFNRGHFAVSRLTAPPIVLMRAATVVASRILRLSRVTAAFNPAREWQAKTSICCVERAVEACTRDPPRRPLDISVDGCWFCHTNFLLEFMFRL